MSLIIFGANGMLGRYISAYFQDRYQIVKFTRKDLDLYRTPISETIVILRDKIKPQDIVINCAGIINKRTVDEAEMYKVNAIIPHLMSRICSENEAQFVQITTDCVFSGTDGGYYPLSLPDALDDYGLSKSIGELIHKGCVLRTSIIGEEPYKRSLVEWCKASVGLQVNGYINHRWNGVTCLELAKQIDKMIDKGFPSGINHITSTYQGKDFITKYDLVRIISEVFELGLDIVKYETPQPCFKNLKAGFLITKDIREQIIEMKEFSSKLQ